MFLVTLMFIRRTRALSAFFLQLRQTVFLFNIPFVIIHALIRFGTQVDRALIMVSNDATFRLDLVDYIFVCGPMRASRGSAVAGS